MVVRRRGGTEEEAVSRRSIQCILGYAYWAPSKILSSQAAAHLGFILLELFEGQCQGLNTVRQVLYQLFSFPALILFF